MTVFVSFISQERVQKGRTENSAVYNLPLAADDNGAEDSGGYGRDKRVVRRVDSEAVYNDGSSLSAIRHRADGSDRGDR